MLSADHVNIVNSGIILPFLPDGRGGVCDSEFNFIESSKYNGEWIKAGGGYDIDTKNIIRDYDYDAIFLGFFYRHWGHFIMDCLGRAWYLCTDDIQKDINQFKIIFLTRNGKEVDGNYLRFFELLGIKRENLLSVTKPTRFRNVIIPRCATWTKEGDLCVTPFQFAASHLILDNGNKDRYDGEDIYLSREHFVDAKHKEIGEKRISKLFKENCFRIYYPEELSLEDQILMFRNAGSIACINGTIPLNIVFCYKTKHPKVLVLNKTSLPHNNLNKVCNAVGVVPKCLDVYNEPIKGHPRYLGEGPFWLKVTDELIRFFKKRGQDISASILNTTRLEEVGDFVKYYWLYFQIRVTKRLIKMLRHIRNRIFYKQK